MNTIEIKNLKKSFYVKGNKKTVEAVKGISLAVKSGEIFGFLGPNGAGKTTTLRMLTTLLPIDEGEVKIGKYDVRRNPKEVRRHIGYVSQLGGADMEATGRENLMLSGRLYGMTRRVVEKQLELLVQLLDLGDIMGRLVKTYSGGQRRRLEIAMGILHKPDVLFLDEPTTGLDPQNRNNLWEHIRKLKSAGMTIFLTTHYLEEADVLCDRLCIMDRGIIVAEGTPQLLKSDICGDLVSIKPKKINQNVKALFDNEDDVLDIQIEGGKTNLYVRNGAIAIPKILDKLKVNGIELESVSLSQPSLDDVFLKKTGKSLRETGRETI